MISKYIKIILALVFFTVISHGCRQETTIIDTESREQITSAGTVTSINPSGNQLLLGMMESYFLTYNPTTDVQLSYTLPQYLSDKKCYVVYKLSANEYLVGKRDSGITYLQYPDTPVDGVFQYSKVVTLSSNNVSKPYRGTRFSLYNLTPTADGLLLAGTSNGLLIISAEDIEAIRQSPSHTTYKIPYYPALKPYRDNHKQHAIEDVIVNNDHTRFIVITDNGLFRLEGDTNSINRTTILDGELPESISTDIHDARHDKSNTIERQARYWSGYVDGKTLHAIKKSASDPNDKVAVSIDDIFNTEDALITEVNTETESPVKLYRERASILSNGNIFTRYGTLDARATYIGCQSITLSGNDLYYISDGHLCRIDLKWVELTGSCQSSPLNVIAHDNNDIFILHGKRLYAINSDGTQNYMGPFDSQVIPAGGTVLSDSIYFHTAEKVYSLSNDVNKYATERVPHSLSIKLFDNTDKVECLGTHDSRLLIGTRISMIEYNPADGSYYSYKIVYNDVDSSQYVNPYYTAISYPYAVTLNNGIFKFNDDNSFEQLKLPPINDMRSVQNQEDKLLVTTPSAAYLVDTYSLSIDTLTSSCDNINNKFSVLCASFIDSVHITVVTTDSILNYVVNENDITSATNSCANTDNINRIVVLGEKPIFVSDYNLINGQQLTANNTMLNKVIWTTIFISITIILIFILCIWQLRKRQRNHETISKLETNIEQAQKKFIALEHSVKCKDQEISAINSQLERAQRHLPLLYNQRDVINKILNDIKYHPHTLLNEIYEVLNKIDINNADDLTLQKFLSDIRCKIEYFLKSVLSLKESFDNSLFNKTPDKLLNPRTTDFKNIFDEFDDNTNNIPDDWEDMEIYEKYTLMRKTTTHYDILLTKIAPFLVAHENPLDENRDMLKDILYGSLPYNAVLPGPLFDNNNPTRVQANFDAFICYMFSNMETKQIRSKVLKPAEYYKDVKVEFEDSRKVQMYALFTTRPTSIIPKFLTEVISIDIWEKENPIKLPLTIYDIIWLNLSPKIREIRRSDLKEYLKNKNKKTN